MNTIGVDEDAARAFNEIATNSGLSAIFGDERAQIVALNILERHFRGGNKLDLTPFEDVRGIIDLSEGARLDPLMKIPNRRAFDERLLSTLARYQRDKKSGQFGIVVVDIDNFKWVNDKYGHLVGDELLRQIASQFKMHLRVNDFVARWGGDEIAILLDNSAAMGEQVFKKFWEERLVLINRGVNDFIELGGRVWPGLDIEGTMTHFSSGLVYVGPQDFKFNPEELTKQADDLAAQDKLSRNVRRGEG